MAEIREDLKLEDKFSSTQKRYISGMEKAAQATVNSQNAATRMAQSAGKMGTATNAAARSQSELKAQIKASQSSVAQLNAEFVKAMDTLDNLKGLGFSDDMLTSQIANADRLAQELTDAEAQYKSLNQALNETVTAEEAAKAAAKQKAAAEKKAAKDAAAVVKAQAKQKAAAEKQAAKEAAALRKEFEKLSKASPGKSLTRQFTRLAATLFSVRKILSFLKNSMENMPEKAQEGWKNLQDSVSAFFKSGISYLLQGMLPGIEKLNQALNSPAGQQFAAVFRELAFEAGQAIGEILSGIAWLVTQMGNDFQSMRGITGMVIQGFQMLGDAVQWVKSNWSTLAPIIQAVVTAILAYKAAVLLVAGAQAVLNGAMNTNPWVLLVSLMVAATQASGPLRIAILAIAAAIGVLNLILNANPIMLIITLIGMVVMAIVDWVKSVGGLEIAWLICMDAIKTAWDYTVAGLNVGIAWVQNLIDSLIIMWNEASVAVANAVGDMKVMALTILQNMVNGAIDIINNFINALNNIPGVNIQAVKHVTFATKAALENEAAKQGRADSLAAKKAEIAKNRADRDQRLNKMFEDAATAHQERQAEILAKQIAAGAENVADNATDSFMNQYGNPMLQESANVSSGVGGSLGSDVSAIKKEVAMSEEELQALVDMAQRQYVNQINLTAQSPIINIKGQNTGDTAEDRKALADTLRDILIEQSSAGTYRSTARVY